MKGMPPSPCWNAPAAFMEETGQPFEVALAVTRAGNLFTTHTAVAAGFDRFSPALIEQYLGGYARTSSASRFTICWPLAARTRTTLRNPLTWLTWPSGAAGRSMA